MEITEADREKVLQPNNADYLGGRSLITLTKFWTFLTTYLPHVDIGEIIPLLLQGGNLPNVDISNTTYPPCLFNVVCERPLLSYNIHYLTMYKNFFISLL